METYKANREAAPDILRQQMGLVRQVLDALGVTVVELAGFEADDIIATVATQAEAEGRDVLIVTGDRDSYQLVHDPLIKVLYNRRGVSDYALYDEAGIKERTGVTPEQYVQYAAMRGDPSDNLPGVPGVGEKTAAKLINNYGGLAGIFEHLDEQTPKLRASLAEHQAQVLQNADVMVLRRDVPIDVDYSALGIAPQPGRGQAPVRVPRVPHAVRPPAGHRWPGSVWSASPCPTPTPRCCTRSSSASRPRPTPSPRSRRCRRPRSPARGWATPDAASCSASPS